MKTGINFFSELEETLKSAAASFFHALDRQNHRLWNYFDELRPHQAEITKAAVKIFLSGESKTKGLIDEAISGAGQENRIIDGYLLGLLMEALLQNRKVLDHSPSNINKREEFGYLIGKFVESKFGAEFRARFNKVIDNCQARYSGEDVNIKVQPMTSSTPSLRLGQTASAA
jgi:hypothetical protein